MNRSIQKLTDAIERIAGTLLWIVTVLIFATALARYAFNSAIPDGFDGARLLLAVSLLWGLAATTYNDTHIRVDVVWMVMPPRLQLIVDIFAEVVIVIFLVLAAWMFATTLGNTYASNEQTYDLRLPIWPAYAAGWLGLLGSVLMGCLRLVYLLTVSPERRAEENAAKAEAFYE
jgi:C4-dicarboxylate transporter, DctQ subunit